MKSPIKNKLSATYDNPYTRTKRRVKKSDDQKHGKCKVLTPLEIASYMANR